MLKRTMLSKSLLIAFSGAGLYGSDAMAQQTPQQLQGVEITGSRIRTIDKETSQPVLTVTAADIVKSGFITASDIVNALTTAGTPIFGRGSVLASNAEQGGAYLDLRNLGAQRTLVLVNGKRWPTSVNGYTDVSNIPAALIERVEILKDGASAIYGSDAISGVVNFILKSKFEGGEASAYYGANEKGDGESHQYDLTWGANNAKGSLMANISINRQGAVFAKDRDITSQSYGTKPEQFGAGFGTGPWGRARMVNPATGAFLSPSVYLNHTGDYNGGGVGADSRNPANYHPFVSSVLNDTYNSTTEMMFQLPSDLKSLLLKGDYELTDHVRLKMTGMYSERESQSQVAGYPLNSLSQPKNPVYISPLSYYNPYGDSVAGAGLGSSTYFARRTIEVPRVADNNFKTLHFDGGFEGDYKVLGNDWTWDAGVNYNKGTGNIDQTGNLNLPNLVKALGPSFLNAAGQVQCGTAANPISSTQCTPFNILGGPSASTAAALNYVMAREASQYGNSTSEFLVNTQGTIFKLPAGDVGLALGAETRKVTGYDTPDSLASSGQTTDLAAQPTSGSYTVKEYYGEVNIPILKALPFADQLSVNLASRYSDYSNFGNTTNSKASFIYKPIKDLLTRGTYAQGFRAPTLGDTFGGGSQSFDFYNDPCDTFRGASKTDPATAARCAAAGVPAGYRQVNQSGAPVVASTQGNAPFLAAAGNAFLTPEKAKTRTLGFVYSPSYVRGLTVLADWYRIDVSNQISAVSAQYIMDQCYVSGQPEFCTSITRDPLTHQINGLSRGNANLGALRTEGVDFGGSYELPKMPYGNFKLSLDGTYLTRYTSKSTDTGPYQDQQGEFPYYRVKANLALDWNLGPWSARFMTRYYAKAKDQCWSNSDSAGVVGNSTIDCTNPFGESNGLGGAGLGYNEKHALIYNDLNVAWETPWKGTISGGVNNIFGVKPRIVYQAGGAGLGFSNSSSVDPSLPIDTFYYVRYSQKF